MSLTRGHTQMRFFSRNPKSLTAKSSAAENVLQILTGYILHMSITSLGGGDIDPLYEEYMGDRRLGEPERKELTIAFQTLRSAKSISVEA